MDRWSSSVRSSHLLWCPVEGCGNDPFLPTFRLWHLVYLAHVLSVEGIRTDTAKVLAIRSLNAPRNCNQGLVMRSKQQTALDPLKKRLTTVPHAQSSARSSRERRWVAYTMIAYASQKIFYLKAKILSGGLLLQCLHGPFGA